MRRTALLSLCIIGAGATCAFVYKTASGPDLVAKYAGELSKAQSMTVDFATLKQGEPTVNYSVKLAKPNLARIETSTKLIVADGKNITTYNKADNTYLVQPETDKDLASLLKPDELSLFAPFFNSGSMNADGAKDLGPKSLGGEDLEAVQIPVAGGGRTVTGYFSPSDALLHRATISMKSMTSMSSTADTTRIISTKDFSLSGSVNAKTYAFVTPDGAKELTLADLNSAKWYSDLGQAESIAAKTGRKVFVDFMASWCGPCHMLHDQVLSTDDFTQKMSKYFVFVQIDVDQQPAVFAQYNGTAMPTQLVLDAQGNELDRMVGYGGPDAFYSFINKDVPAGG
jgi:thiol-disulfide isomerase/thioredoxin/outer membrane lipoprotein-sorting protein